MEYIELLKGNISANIVGIEKIKYYTKHNDYYLYTEYDDKNIIPYITFHTNAERNISNTETEKKLYKKRIVLESIKGQGDYFYYISLIVYLSDYFDIAKTLLGNIDEQRDDTIKTKLTESFYDILEGVLKNILYKVIDIDTTKINLRKSYIKNLDKELLAYLNEVLIEFMKLVDDCKEKMKKIQETMKDTDTKITMKINVNLVKSLWNSLIKKSNTKILDKNISLLGYLLHKMGLIHLVHCNESLNKTSSVLILKLAQSYFGSWKNLFTHTFIKDIQSTIEILQEYNATNRITGDFKIENCEGDTNKKSGGNTKKYTKHLKHLKYNRNNRNNKNITKKLR